MCTNQVMGVSLSVYATSLSLVNLLLILLYCYMFRSYHHHQAENILIARITQLTQLDIKDDHYNVNVNVKKIADPLSVE
jgi:hypothetical protein